MGLITTVWVSTQFEGYHRWLDAPEDVGFLRNYHRHLFKVRIGVEVNHNDREVEFFQFKRQVEEYFERIWNHKQFSASCEEIAACILTTFKARWVEVSEDGENGATVERCDQKEIGVSNKEKQTRCFVGTEAEGPSRGAKVLFIPGKIQGDELLKVFEKIKGTVSRLYYGAGNDRELNGGILNALNEIRKTNYVEVDIEVDKIATAQEARGGVIGYKRIILWGVDTADCNDVLKTGLIDYVKFIEDSSIIWKGRDRTYYTSIDDPLFAQDRFVGD